MPPCRDSCYRPQELDPTYSGPPWRDNPFDASKRAPLNEPKYTLVARLSATAQCPASAPLHKGGFWSHRSDRRERRREQNCQAISHPPSGLLRTSAALRGSNIPPRTKFGSYWTGFAGRTASPISMPISAGTTLVQREINHCPQHQRRREWMLPARACAEGVRIS